MTTSLDGYEFNPEPEVTFGSEAEYEKQAGLFQGTTLQFTGYAPILITIDGELTGANCYTDRDTLMAKLAVGAKMDFYSDTISYGTSGSPKQVIVRGYNFFHPIGYSNSVPFQIILELET